MSVAIVDYCCEVGGSRCRNAVYPDSPHIDVRHRNLPKLPLIKSGYKLNVFDNTLGGPCMILVSIRESLFGR